MKNRAGTFENRRALEQAEKYKLATRRVQRLRHFSAHIGTRPDWENSLGRNTAIFRVMLLHVSINHSGRMLHGRVKEVGMPGRSFPSADVRASTPTVFIVDDDATTRTITAKLVQTLGFSTDCFASGQEFLNGYDCQKTGCVILDYQMPGLNGVEVQRALKVRELSIANYFCDRLWGRFLCCP
jgi:hypothetical protein